MKDYIEKVLLCEDSWEGVFTGIYEAYARKFELNNTRISVKKEEEIRFFSEYYEIETDYNKAGKVAGTIQRNAGMEVYRQLHMALASTDPQKGDAVFKTVVQIVRQPEQSKRVMERLTEAYIQKAFALFRNVQNELFRMEEFLRFQELDNRVLYSCIGPNSNVLAYLMPHFSNRFPMENFLIYDEKRKLLGVHPAGADWYLIHDMHIVETELRFSMEEERYRELFKLFCHKITINERENLKLQRNMLPLRFRDYMTEF